MKPATIIGIALIILGIVALAYRGITYPQREKIVDIGPVTSYRGPGKNYSTTAYFRRIVFGGRYRVGDFRVEIEVVTVLATRACFY